MNLVASISGDISFNSSSIDGNITAPSTVLSGSITFGGESYEVYDGPYEFTPKTEEQIAYTENKRAKQDIIIEEIPYFESDNLSGGKTVTIAFL